MNRAKEVVEGTAGNSSSLSRAATEGPSGGKGCGLLDGAAGKGVVGGPTMRPDDSGRLAEGGGERPKGSFCPVVVR